MSTAAVTHKLGDRVTVRIGGQTHTMTIGDVFTNITTGEIEAIRSTDPADHVWTHMWVSVGCVQS